MIICPDLRSDSNEREDPDLLLMGFVDAAVLRLVTEVEARYPELSRHAEGLPKDHIES
jgi:hypothetical protein